MFTNPAGPRTGRPPSHAPRAMVASPHALATGAGVSILRRGGSAVDAAIATNAVLAVVYPHMAGLGGDAFWLLHDPSVGSVEALDASGPAAARATRGFYAERGEHDAIPSRGPMAALTVPGAVDGWRLAHERYGSLPWTDLFGDAVAYARDGFPVGRSLADWTVEDAELLAQDARAARTFLVDGRPPRSGELLRQAELARTLEGLAERGARAGFYEGGIAAAICDALGPDSPLSADDFAGYAAEWVDPIATTYRGREVYEFPPSTQGFAALQLLNLIEGFDVAAWGDGGVDYYHHLAEAVKVAFADRDAWLADPRRIDIPVDRFVSKGYADERRGLIERERSLPMGEVAPGIAWPGAAARTSPGGDTVAFSVVDERGQVVSVIQSIYHDFGSGVVGGESGVILQNRGSFFALDADHPNALEPGKRPFHTLIPGMVLEGGRPVLAFGSMGGEGQPQTHAALITRTFDFGYDVQQAIEAPRWLMGRTWGTASRDLWLEGRIGDEVARALRRRGQSVQLMTDWNDNMGHAQAIYLDPETRWLVGGADPRGDGAAAGY